jgi:hypothetical protein
MSKPTIIAISVSASHTPMLRCTTGATSSGRPTELRRRTLRPLACRPGSCMPWSAISLLDLRGSLVDLVAPA